MSNIATTKLSSKGQVVIPEDIRQQLKLEPGTQFVVLADKDTIILKSIQKPRLEDLNHLMKEAQSQAEAAGITEQDLLDAIKESRRKK